MNDFSTKKSLSPGRRQLLTLMQRYNFCRIENLGLREGGEPFCDRETRVTQDIRIGGSNDPRPELDKDDFLLRAPVVEFFEHLNRIGEGRIALIEVRSGIPVRLMVQQPVSEEQL